MILVREIKFDVNLMDRNNIEIDITIIDGHRILMKLQKNSIVRLFGRGNSYNK